MQVQGTGTSFLSGVQSTGKTLKKTSSELRRILEQLSTAQRINHAGDDASGLAISEQFNTQIRGFKIASENAENAMSALSIADGTADQITGLLQRQRELAISAKNGTLNDNDRSVLDTEFQSLTAEIDRLSSSTQYNNQNVTSGTDFVSGNAVVQAGPNASDQITIPKVDMSLSSLGISGNTIKTTGWADAALTAIDSALKSVGSQRSNLGSTINRLESSMNNMSVALVNTQAADSVIRDEDMAKGLAELSKNRLLQEGSIKAFSRFNEISQNHVLGLFGF
jgi:flagellin